VVQQINPVDALFMAYLAFISILAALHGAWEFIPIHVLAAMVPLVLSALHMRCRTTCTWFLRNWYILPAIIAIFRELHYLVPIVHQVEDARYDRLLASFDEALFGNVDGFFLGLLTPWLADLLHVCYWTYFPAMVLPAIWIYRDNRMKDFQSYITLMSMGFFTSYLGYFFIPAFGPHVFYEVRPGILDGMGVGAVLHGSIVAMELSTPDAFPSGHTLLYILTLIGSARWAPALFPWLLPAGIGCIAATVTLRYHYLVDLIASIILVPWVLLASQWWVSRWQRFL
jgi:hypothetical protein